jgi:tRNA(fMet)-specific endonuclease VapC
MKYLLDTNTCIRHLNQRSPAIIRKLSSLSIEDVAICSIVKAEMFAGAAKSQTPQQSLAKQQAFLNRFVCLPFDDKAAEVYRPLRAKLEVRGKPIGALDMLIAATAIANNVILVTHNIAEFSRIDGLKLSESRICLHLTPRPPLHAMERGRKKHF